MNNNVIFLSQLDNTLKELLLLGYGIIEDAYLLELDKLSKTAISIGFDAFGVLINELYQACNNYLRLDNDMQAMQITKSIAVLQFAIASLNLGVEQGAYVQEPLEQVLDSL